jgi:hypothetical protein
MHHVTMIEYTPGGHLGVCETCGDRAKEFGGYGEADKWCREHERKAKYLRLNSGSRPGIKTAEKIYRENGHNMVYTPEERTVWLMMADELADEIAARNPGQLEGQMELWDPPEGETG